MRYFSSKYLPQYFRFGISKFLKYLNISLVLSACTESGVFIHCTLKQPYCREFSNEFVLNVPILRFQLFLSFIFSSSLSFITSWLPELARTCNFSDHYANPPDSTQSIISETREHCSPGLEDFHAASLLF